MSSAPGPVYGLEVPPGELLIPANKGMNSIPTSFRITMAALDPTQPPEADQDGNLPTVPRSTLRLVKRDYFGPEGDDDYMEGMLGESDEEEEEEEEEEEDDDDEVNGGPSDPAKVKKQQQAAAIEKLMAAANGDDSEDEEMADAGANARSNRRNGKAGAKGKGKAVKDEEESDEEDEDDDSEGGAFETLVLCTLDADRHYQQPLDITITPGEKVFFMVSGSHTVYLTGNYEIDEREEEDDEDEEEDGDYELAEDLDFVVGDEVSEDESDELDDIDISRITEVDTDEEEAPKLVAAAPKKGKNKRPAEAEAAAGLDELMDKAASAKDTKASKKQEKQEKQEKQQQQQKKLKNNKGEAVAAAAAAEAKKDAKKTVQFAKNLEQGPTGSAEKAKEAKETGKKGTITQVQGVTVDDRTAGKGRTAKKGDTVGVRYIGKLTNGQQFDAKKKGKPFYFKLGKGEVIKGWDIGVVGMAIGGERRLTIPAHLAYGSKAIPGIPANSTLVFDIKLLEIK